MGSPEAITSIFYNWFLLGQAQMKNVSHFKQNDVPQRENPLIEFPCLDDFYFPKYLKAHRQRLRRLMNAQDREIVFSSQWGNGSAVSITNKVKA